MLDLKKIRLEPEKVKTALFARNVSCDVDFLLELDEKKRQLLQQSDELKNERNDYNKQIGKARRNAENESAILQLTERIRQTASRIEAIDNEVQLLNEKIFEILRILPNLPAQTTPVGEADCKSPVVRTYGTARVFPWEPKTYQELGSDLQLCTELHTSDSPTLFYQKAGATFKRALINFLLDSLLNVGYHELACAKAKEVLEKYQNLILDASSLPMLYCAEAATTEFRPLIVVNGFSTPEASGKTLETMAADIAELLHKLEIPCRISNLCSNKLDFEAAQVLSVEVWMPGKQQFVEVVHLANCTDYISRDLSIRYRTSSKEKPLNLHTLRGDFCIDMLIASIWENLQIDDGNIAVPDCLQRYTGQNIICKQC